MTRSSPLGEPADRGSLALVHEECPVQFEAETSKKAEFVQSASRRISYGRLSNKDDHRRSVYRHRNIQQFQRENGQRRTRDSGGEQTADPEADGEVDHEQRHGTSLVTAPPDDARERERDGCRDEEYDLNRVYPVVHATLSV